MENKFLMDMDNYLKANKEIKKLNHYIGYYVNL